MCLRCQANPAHSMIGLSRRQHKDTTADGDISRALDLRTGWWPAVARETSGAGAHDGCDVAAKVNFTHPMISPARNVDLAGGTDVDVMGIDNCALVAGPLSPEKPAVPVPAMVFIIPLPSISRTLWLEKSARKILSALSIATPTGAWICALVAGPPSPEKPATPGSGNRCDDTTGINSANSVIEATVKIQLPKLFTAIDWG